MFVKKIGFLWFNFLFLFALHVNAANLVVDNTPSFFSNCEGFIFSNGPNYSTIQSALSAANNGDTIKVCKGDYNEQATVLKDNLTITNGSDVSTPLDVNWYYNDDVLTVGDSSKTIKNLKVENISIHSTSTSSNSKAININYAKNKITLQDMLIKTDGADAIYAKWNVNSNLKGVYKNLTIQSGGSGIFINKGDLQDFENIDLNLTGSSANDKAIYLETGVSDKNHIFKHISFTLKNQPAIKLSSGKKMVFEDINISASNYSDNTKAIDLDYSTTADNLLFKSMNIELNKGKGVYVAKAKDITVQNVAIKGTTEYAFYTDSQVSGNLSFKNIDFLVNSNYGLFVKNGDDLTINKANFSGSSANGIALKTDWGVTGDFNFTDLNVTTHTGGIEISKGKNVSFNNVVVNSDSSSANDKGVKFDWGGFKNMNIINCELNATGNALEISGSDNLTIDNSKFITYGDKAVSIDNNVKKMNLTNSCIYNFSSSGNSYAIYLNNWKNDLHVNNNCIHAPNGGNYARDTKVHDWDGNNWNGVIDVNGDGKISNTDTNRISSNITDNNPKTACTLIGCMSAQTCGTDYNGTLNLIQMVGDNIAIKNTYSDPTFTHKTYKDNFVFSQPPVIFILPNTNGGNPASMRVKNVDTRGFDIAITEPQGEDGAHIAMNVDYFAVNQGVFKLGNHYIEVGTVETNKVQKGYDVASNDWVEITPKVHFCNPVVLAQIQGMENEPGYVPNKISKPFLSVAVDSNYTNGTIKFALERGETNLGNVDKNETIAYLIAEGNYQDVFIDDYNSSIDYETIKTDPIFYGWDDSAVTKNFVNSYSQTPLVAATINSRYSLDGGWFRKKTHNKTSITLVIDEDRKTNRSGNGSVQDSERSKKKNVANGNPITPEIGGIFAFSGQFIKNAVADPVSNFNAVDFGQGSSINEIYEGNITTKVSNIPFKLDIIARGDDNVSKIDANITKLELVKCADEACVDCKITNEAIDFNLPNTLQISSSSGYVSTPDLTINEAYPLCKIRITGKNVNSADEVTVCSSDLFAIRPNNFDITIPSNAYAGENFTIDFDANKSNHISGYNEELNSSFSITKAIPSGCDTGDLNIPDFNFTNGSASVDVNYSDIGDINLTISEIDGSEFAKVDRADTTDTQRFITPQTKSLTIKPYEINVSKVSYVNSTGNNWLYMSDVNDSYVEINSTIQVNNKSHVHVKNFKPSCVAKDVQIQNFFSVINPNNNVNVDYEDISSYMDNNDTNISNINKTFTIPSSDFNGSSASIVYKYNIKRYRNILYSPINIALDDVKILTNDVAKYENNATTSSLISNDMNTTFYYGRVKTKDIITNKQDVNHSLHVEVYDTTKDSYVNGFHQVSLNWYVMENDNNQTINETDFNASTTFSNSNDVNLTISDVNYSNGILNFKISNQNEVSNAYIHVDVPTYLWYSKYNDYNISDDCAHHPCFRYDYIGKSETHNIHSGDFNGTTIGREYNATKTKKGVKVFR
jgi:hypothetical protein